MIASILSPLLSYACCLQQVALVGLAVCLAALLAVFCVRQFAAYLRGFGRGPLAVAVALVALVAAVAIGGGKIVPSIQWGVGLRNDGSSFDTNTWRTVRFKWLNTGFANPDASVVFCARDRATPDVEWLEIGETGAVARYWEYTWPGGEIATNYQYYAFLYEPSIHTNGVWLGNFVRKARGSSGTDNIVIINGSIVEDGKKIAPIKQR